MYAEGLTSRSAKLTPLRCGGRCCAVSNQVYRFLMEFGHLPRQARTHKQKES
jgi:hypothetical protein